ncbi:predicted protein [Sclerotinia sclerotiorum 1980 UF-70]|uniref:Uncharacterized protein n=1 Tax=Sclerotinia sclerotiorum (strain ATCC 18683 / 1980 / Ss-1) TaxID=665079 RepID=A7ESI8_SCLS1|nr:predicted protein [Sclerotinia sclerotiorum 1980 UF-70]EDN92430.1 predicted protein [Sclerotinia sclerotiorum 1980 UF-70]
MPRSMQSPEEWKNGSVAIRACGALLGTLAQNSLKNLRPIDHWGDVQRLATFRLESLRRSQE